MAYTKKIAVQFMSEKKDDIGQEITSWETVFEPWANVDCTGGKEYYAAAQINSENDMIFRIRYTKLLRGKLTSDIRILYDSMIFDVVHISDHMEQHREWEIRARQLNGGVRI